MTDKCLDATSSLRAAHKTLAPGSADPASGAPANHSLIQAHDALLAASQRGVAYSGFRAGQHPNRGEGASLPTDEQILEDLKILSNTEGFELIRLYDSQQNSADVLRLIRQHNIPLKVMLGMWLDAELSNHEGCAWITQPASPEQLAINTAKNQTEIESGIRLANEYSDSVIAVNVGNESLVTWNDHLVSLESMVSHLSHVRKNIRQPVTTADNYKVFSQYGAALADHLDFLAVHTYPQWEGKNIDQALSYTIENLAEIRSVLPHIPIVIAEAGWASEASEFGPRASEETQTLHYNELMNFGRAHNISVFWFEAFDEDWKGAPDNPQGAEKHWGLYNIDRTPKAATTPISETS